MMMVILPANNVMFHVKHVMLGVLTAVPLVLLRITEC